MPRIALVTRFVVLVFVGFFASAWAGQAIPAPARPMPGTVSVGAIRPLPESISVQGRGAEGAATALAVASKHLPFRALLPQRLPPGFALVQSTARVFSAQTAYVDLVYLGPVKGQLQLYEANYAVNKPASASAIDSSSVELAGTTWEYKLLSYPQPSGRALMIHSLTRQFDGSLYISIALHGRGPVEAEKTALLSVAASLE